MSVEETIQSQLIAQFPVLEGKVRVQRARRVFAEVPAEQATAVIEYAYKTLGFTIICTITGLDLGDKLAALYHIAHQNGVVLNLPVLQTVSALYPPADHYEREMIDLLGFKVEGLPKGNRYPLPDSWPAGQYPLRKDWKVEMLPPSGPGESEMKNG
jgi:Ni,Fe-hydrogenase III component G